MVWFVRLFPFSLSSFFFHLLVSFVMRLPQSLALLCVTRNTLRSGINRIKARSSNRHKMQPSRPRFGTSPPAVQTPAPHVTWTVSFAITHDIVCELCIGNIFVFSVVFARRKASCCCLIMAPGQYFFLSIFVLFSFILRKEKGSNIKTEGQKTVHCFVCFSCGKTPHFPFCFSLIVILDFIPQVLRARQC